MTLAFRNRQRTRALNLPLLRRITRHLLREEFKVTDCELCFHFVEPEEMAEVNWQFLQHEGSTDVITFDHSESGAPSIARRGFPCSYEPSDARRSSSAAPLHGEVFISVADAVKQAREFKTTWQAELARYVIHGLLHLCGYDDLQPAQRRVMKREENRLLKAVAASFPLTRLRASKDAGTSRAARHSSFVIRHS